MKCYEDALQVAISHREVCHKFGSRCEIHIVEKNGYFTTAYSKEELDCAIKNGFKEIKK